jgi:hypothetical protein
VSPRLTVSGGEFQEQNAPRGRGLAAGMPDIFKSIYFNDLQIKNDTGIGL